MAMKVRLIFLDHSPFYILRRGLPFKPTAHTFRWSRQPACPKDALQLQSSSIYMTTGDLDYSLQAYTRSFLAADSFTHSLLQHFLGLSLFDSLLPSTHWTFATSSRPSIHSVFSMKLTCIREIPIYFSSSIYSATFHLFSIDNQWLISCWRTLLTSWFLL